MINSDKYKSMFAVDSQLCQITQYALYTKKEATVDTFEPFENPSTSVLGASMTGENGFDGLLINTKDPFNYENLYIRAATANANYVAYLPVSL